MLEFQISGEGRTLDDVVEAIEEARRSIQAGNTSGTDRNETGDYTFSVDGTDEADA